MTPFLLLLTKATILASLGLLAVHLSARSRAAVRHAILAAMFAAQLALPFAGLLLPGIAIEMPNTTNRTLTRTSQEPHPSATAPETVNTSPVVATRTSPFPATQLLGALWSTGSLLILSALAANLFRLRTLRRTGLPPSATLQALARTIAARSGLKRMPEILLHDRISAPLTYGFFNPLVLLPLDAEEAWTEEALEHALIHEFEHINRADWPTQLAARIACAVYWFHPLLWTAWRRLCVEAERACDDAVVIANADPGVSAGYAGQLVQLARRISATPHPITLGMARRSDLSERVHALLDTRLKRGRTGALAAALTALAAMLTVGAIAPVKAVAQIRSNTPGVSSLDQALFDAAAAGDTESVDRLLAAGANANARLAGDGSPLIAAARRGHLRAARLLLDRGADPNLPVSGDGSPLIAAARSGHVDIAQLLLGRNANIDQIVVGDENPLIQAAGSGHIGVVKLLISRGANVNIKVLAEPAPWRPLGEWRSPLIMAKKRGHTEIVQLLTSEGAKD